MLIDGYFQVVEAAKLIEIGLRHMGVHEGDEFRLVHAETSHERVDFTILSLGLIVSEVVAEGTVGIDLHVITLNVMEEDLGDFLLFLGKR